MYGCAPRQRWPPGTRIRIAKPDNFSDSFAGSRHACVGHAAYAKVPPSRENQSPTAVQHFENMLNHDRVPAPTPSTHAVQWRPAGYILSDVPCRQAMPWYDMPGLPCMPAPPPPNVSWKLTGGCLRHSANGLMKCATTTTEGTPATDKNPLKEIEPDCR